MPFQHSEHLADQNRSLLLFTELGDDDSSTTRRSTTTSSSASAASRTATRMLGRAPRPDEIAAGDVFPW